MKKFIAILAIVAFAGSMTSCKKDYTCTCTATVLGFTSTSKTTIKNTKKKAEEACTANQTTTAGVTYSCKLD